MDVVTIISKAIFVKETNALLHYYFTGNKITIQITYWQDGIDHAIETASNCSTPTGVANKVAKFLDLK